MSVLSVQNIQETFIGKNIARTGSAQVLNPNAPNYIADGEVVIVNSVGQVYDASSMSNVTSPWIQVVQRNGDNLVWSSKINYNRLIAVRGKAAAYGQEQIYHIGYNGTSGSLDITSGLDFTLTVIENQDDMQWSEQKKKNVVNVPSNLVVSQLDLAKAIVKNQMKKYTTDGSSITAYMLSDGTGAIFTGATTINVVHGSNVIVPNNAITNVGFGAGSVIRLGATNSAVGTSVGVYTVQGAHPTIANAWILDQPYAGPSNTALAVANAGVVTGSVNWGVRFTGKALPFRRDFFKFKRVGFTLQMSGFGATILSKTQDSTYGSGDGRLVLEEESFSKGFEGALNRMTVPLPLANETFTADGTSSQVVMTTAAASVSNTAITSTGSYATITTTANHNFQVGQVVTLAANAGAPLIAGTYTIVAVPATNTFTIVNTTAAGVVPTNGTTVTPVSTNGDAFVYPTTMYSCMTFEFTSQDSATVVQPPAMPQLVKIYMPVLANQATTANTGVQPAVSDWVYGNTTTVIGM